MSEENTNSSQNNRRNQRHGIQAAVEHMLSNKVDALLWLTRLGTVIFSLISFSTLIGLEFRIYMSYQRALLCNAAASALRLHQRLPRVQLTTEFGAMLMMEDSCHYLLYSLLFIYSHTVQIALVPIFLYSILNTINYSTVLLMKLGLAESWLAITLQDVLTSRQRSILRFVALAEIVLFPFTVFMMLLKGSILAPFAYYRFLTFRYSSRRNPYTRGAFMELRLMLEGCVRNPTYPYVVRQLCHKVIETVSWMAPVVAQHQR